MKVDKFNIRVYCIVVWEEKLLIVQENLRGFEFVKLPGGGVELGEGLIDALKREIMEELNTDISGIEHFYTTDFFQRSAFRKNEQVVSVYYKIQLSNNPINGFEIKEHHHHMTFFWKPMSEISSSAFTFPIDQHVIDLLILERTALHPKT